MTTDCSLNYLRVQYKKITPCDFCSQILRGKVWKSCLEKWPKLIQFIFCWKHSFLFISISPKQWQQIVRWIAKIEIVQIEIAKIEIAKIETAKIETAKIEIAKIEIAKIETAKIEIAKIEIAKNWNCQNWSWQNWNRQNWKLLSC